MSDRIFRETKQRNAINNAFRNADRPLNPKEVLAIAENEVENLGIATVYRNIKSMLESGEIITVPGVDIAPCYVTPAVRDKHSGTIYVENGHGQVNATILFQLGNSIYYRRPADTQCSTESTFAIAVCQPA